VPVTCFICLKNGDGLTNNLWIMPGEQKTIIWVYCVFASFGKMIVKNHDDYLPPGDAMHHVSTPQI